MYSWSGSSIAPKSGSFLGLFPQLPRSVSAASSVCFHSFLGLSSCGISALIPQLSSFLHPWAVSLIVLFHCIDIVLYSQLVCFNGPSSYCFPPTAHFFHRPETLEWLVQEKSKDNRTYKRRKYRHGLWLKNLSLFWALNWFWKSLNMTSTYTHWVT